MLPIVADDAVGDGTAERRCCAADGANDDADNGAVGCTGGAADDVMGSPRMLLQFGAGDPLMQLRTVPLVFARGTSRMQWNSHLEPQLRHRPASTST